MCIKQINDILYLCVGWFWVLFGRVEGFGYEVEASLETFQHQESSWLCTAGTWIQGYITILLCYFQ